MGQGKNNEMCVCVNEKIKKNHMYISVLFFARFSISKIMQGSMCVFFVSRYVCVCVCLHVPLSGFAESFNNSGFSSWYCGLHFLRIERTHICTLVIHITKLSNSHISHNTSFKY